MGGYCFGTVESESFSVYRDPVRSNNDIEAFNCWLNAKYVRIHLNFGDFVGFRRNNTY